MIHQQVSAHTLGVVRYWVFGIWFLKIAIDPFQLLAELPHSIFEPYRVVMRFIPTAAWSLILEKGVLFRFKFLLLTFVGLSMFGLRPYRLIVTVTVVLLTFHQGVVRGFGHINHSEFPLLYASYVLALFPAADGFVWPKRQKNLKSPAVYSAALLLMTILMLLTYTTTAAFRLAHGGTKIFLGNTIKHHLSYHAFRPSYHGFDFGKHVLTFPSLALLAKLSFPIITCFELLAPLCLICRCFRHVWLVVMTAFHLATFFLMNIFFWANLLLFPVLLTDIAHFISTFPLKNTRLTDSELR